MNNSNNDNLNYRRGPTYKSTNESIDSQRIYHSFLDDIFPEDRANMQEPVKKVESKLYVPREVVIAPKESEIRIDKEREAIKDKPQPPQKRSKKEFKRSAIKKILILICTIISVLAPIINYAFRLGYVYIDNEVYEGFSELLFYIMILVAFVSILYAIRAFLNPKKIPIIVTMIFILFSVFGIFFNVVNYVTSTIAYPETAVLHLKAYFPYVIALLGVPLLLFVFPLIQKKKRNIIAAIVGVVFVAAMAVPIVSTYPLTFKFMSDPVVFDVGGGYYSVVFGVNANSQGFVEYKYNNIEYKLYSLNDGEKKIDTIHAIKVPREHLENNKYSVGSTKVITKLAYGGKLGNTINSKVYSFEGERKTGDLTMTVVSDWHYKIDLLEKAVNYLENPDLILIVGDYADFYVDKSQIITYMLVGAAKISKSVKPVIYVRGNHEARFDSIVQNIPELLGLDNFYYQVERGDYLFTVLDSGESEHDDHWQHKGFNAYRQYLTQELDWFRSLPVVEDKYNIVLSHDFNYAEPEDIKADFRTAMESFNASMEISGHWHRYVLDQVSVPDGLDYYEFVDGGLDIDQPDSVLNVFYVKKYEFFGSQIKFQGDNVYFKTVSDKGTVVLNETRTKVPQEKPEEQA
ncbi:MAG: metallophosphoesterase [Christensenellaceae bacterium]|jgi:predicted phosphodiesterase|nr:metallophosphoesterase [Christensenellaceae bacterium]